MNIWCEKGAYISKKARKKLEKFDPLKIKKITVIRHAALGDMIITRAFLTELREFFPNAQITFSLIENYLYGKPVDLYDIEHIVYKKKGLKEKIKSIKSLGEQDIIFDFASTSYSKYVTLFNKSKIKIGFPYRSIEKKVFYDMCVFRSDFEFEGEIMLNSLKLLGHNPNSILDYSLKNYKENNIKKRIVYFFGASTPNKKYPENKFYRLVEELSKELNNYQHILLQGINDDEKFKDLPVSLKKENNIIIQKSLELDDLIDFLSESRLCVSADTGVRNVAIATHTPTIGIFYSTVPFRYLPKYENGHNVVFLRDGSLPTIENVKKIVYKNLSTNVRR